MPKYDVFKPKGKNDEQVLKSLLEEAFSVIREFDRTSSRHVEEIALYREDNPWNTNGKDFDTWIKEVAFKNLFERGEPEKFSYDFHELRRTFLESIDSGTPFDQGDMFESICKLTGVGPIVKTIFSAHRSQDVLYDFVEDERSAPKLNIFMLDLLGGVDKFEPVSG